MIIMGLTIGQKLWFVPSYNYQPFDVEVKSIGRKWAKVAGGRTEMRLDIETLRPHEDDGSGIAYLSREDYEARQALSQEWLKLRASLSRSSNAPDGVTVKKIAEARKLLGMDAV